ncbi:iron complex outermembrane receptor protein [Pseudomonas sp. BIGb0408]|uniref:Iron complex outermembrane receptor protein n=1 Tax=Phytopseudomonas flavescens TaxID=29435 RepID=A0A7Z0BMQ0_9GAMM|nr:MULTISPECIES: TonB-dependent siderophore receptor [Pseudomonas]MCW2293349.1 iron complex outermembrane receptor protein [Pseudomonas sp. BIGb0408]NYH72080.1 iron complex outermembrane receptor protein [Pseudomonas flavescens]
MALPRPRFAPTLLAIALSPTLSWAADSVVALDATTIEDQAGDSYQARGATVGGFTETPLLDTPASVSVVTRQLLDDQQARLLSDVLKNDASVGEAYAPIGYYENFVVRGFSLNAANSYRVNGRSVVGEQNVALENKQQVELLKGLSGLQSGVVEPGGLVNYVTKRTEQVRSLSVASNQDGERYIAADLGHWFGNEQELGLRLNLAHEDIRSFVEHADGKRDFISLALDWNLSPNATLQLDAEYQTREQRSVAGYQLLGGTQVPSGVDPDKRLGHQSWSKPVGIDSLNLGGRFEYRFDDNWKAAIDASRSQVVIDDYSSFPYGCSPDSGCNDWLAHFSPEGGYDIYDYRSPDDTRRHDELQATLSGAFTTGTIGHELTVGSSALRRTVDRRSSVNVPIGTGNINEDVADFAPTDVPLNPKNRRLDSRQYGLFFSDRISFDEHWQVLLGGRQVRLDEEAFTSSGISDRRTRRSELLPNAALLYKPQADTTLYVSYSKGLSLGGEAPWFTTNDGEILAPTISRQLEAGFKRDWQGLSLGAALFRIDQALQYSRPNDDGTLTYVQQGKQRNIGLELSASGQAARDLQLSASAAVIRARAIDSGTEAYEGHQAVNVPRVRASLSADYRIPGVQGLSLLGGLQYSGSKYANPSGTVKVADYTVFNLGSRYTTRIEGYETVLRLTVDNLFDKRYWRDTGAYQGDGYLFPGDPRTARLSATVSF